MTRLASRRRSVTSPVVVEDVAGLVGAVGGEEVVVEEEVEAGEGGDDGQHGDSLWCCPLARNGRKESK